MNNLSDAKYMMLVGTINDCELCNIIQSLRFYTVPDLGTTGLDEGRG